MEKLNGSVDNTDAAVPEIASHREQVRHILQRHKETLERLRKNEAEKAGMKRAGSSIDAGSPKRMRTES